MSLEAPPEFEWLPKNWYCHYRDNHRQHVLLPLGWNQRRIPHHPYTKHQQLRLSIRPFLWQRRSDDVLSTMEVPAGPSKQHTLTRPIPGPQGSLMTSIAFVTHIQHFQMIQAASQPASQPTSSGQPTGQMCWTYAWYGYLCCRNGPTIAPSHPQTRLWR